MASPAPAPPPAPNETTELMPKEADQAAQPEESMTWTQWLQGPGKWSRWIFWICFAQGISTLANALPGCAANYVMPDLNLTDSQFGTAMGLSYELPFAIGSIIFALAVGGGLPVRPHYLLVMCCVITNLGSTLVGTAQSFGTLCLWRAVTGIGMIAMFPAFGALFEEICPPGFVGAAWSVFLGFITLGASAANFVVGGLCETLGWRNSIFVFGILGMAAGLVLLVFPPPPPSTRVHVGWANFRPFRMPAAENKLSLNECLCRAPVVAPTLPILALAGLFIDVQGGSWATYGQLWLVDERNMTITRAANTSGWALIGGCLIGIFLALMVVDRMKARFNLVRPYVLAIALLFILPFDIMATSSSPDTAWFYIGFFSCFMQATLGLGQMFACVQELSPPRIVGTTTAVIQFVNRIGNTGGSFIGGYVVDALRDGGSNDPYTWVLRIGYFSTIVTILSAIWAAPSFEAGKAALYELIGTAPDEDDANADDVEKTEQEPPAKDDWY